MTVPTTDVGSEEEYLAFVRGKLVAIAQAMMDAEIGIIAGSRKLSEYGSRLYKGDFLDEEYFVTFDEIASSAAHLPVDWERSNWSEEALKQKDVEIAEYEAKVREDVLAACKKLIEKYEPISGI